MVVGRWRCARRWSATRFRTESFFALDAKPVRALTVTVEGAKIEV